MVKKMEQKRTKLTFKQLRYYARMAADAYVSDPVHMYATKHEKWRKRYDYHFMLARLMTSNREDIIYTDEEHRGICIWRDAHNAYTIFDFWLCPTWPMLAVYAKSTIKILKAYSHLDAEVFEKNTLIISPVFTDPAHQGKGIATKLIKQGIADLVPLGYKLGLETQNPANVSFYEKLGFETVKYVYFKGEKIHNYYMVYNPDSDKAEK
ncbi:MAG: GNAT family N-acetyltransferase [Ruminococcaceae bacterium]|nr:GNAT family N-acetyltransferase [Oscillospiraceae bacterium]